MKILQDILEAALVGIGFVSATTLFTSLLRLLLDQSMV